MHRIEIQRSGLEFMRASGGNQGETVRRVDVIDAVVGSNGSGLGCGGWKNERCMSRFCGWRNARSPRRVLDVQSQRETIHNPVLLFCVFVRMAPMRGVRDLHGMLVASSI